MDGNMGVDAKRQEDGMRRKSANGQFVAVMGRRGQVRGGQARRGGAGWRTDGVGDLLCPRISFSVKTATRRITMHQCALQRGEGVGRAAAAGDPRDSAPKELV